MNSTQAIALIKLLPLKTQQWIVTTQQKKKKLLTQQATKQKSKKYTAFQAKYFDDYAGFLLDCVNWPEGRGPALYQLEIADEVLDYKRYSVRSPRKAGKTSLAALLILFFALTREGLDWKIPTTASVFRQLEKFLWREVPKWSNMLKWDVIGRKPFVVGKELLTTQLKLETGEAFAAATDRGVSIEGAHADHLLIIIDEAKAVSDEIFDSLEGSLNGKNRFVFCISTPGPQIGRFYDIHAKKKAFKDSWRTRHVTKAEAIASGQMQDSWVEEMKLLWGETDWRYLNHIEGEFAADDANSIIPHSFVSMSNARHNKWLTMLNVTPDKLTPNYIGLDVGGENDKSDPSVFAFYKLPSLDKVYTLLDSIRDATRYSATIQPKLNALINEVRENEYTDTRVLMEYLKDILERDDKAVIHVKELKSLLEPYNNLNALKYPVITHTRQLDKLDKEAPTVQLANECVKLLDKHPNCIVSIDSIGSGKGVPDILKSKGYGKRIIKFDVRKGTHLKSQDGEEKFKNIRSAMWYFMMERLHKHLGDNLILPESDDLIGQLTVVQRKRRSSLWFEVESKDDIKKRIHRSTDDADAVLMAVFAPLFSSAMSDNVLDLNKFFADKMKESR